MKKKKEPVSVKRIAVVFIVLLVALFGSFELLRYTIANSFSDANQMAKEVENKSVDDGLAICRQKTDKINNMCVIQVALNNKNDTRVIDASICDFSTTKNDVDFCFYIVALDLKNAELCEKIANEVIREECVTKINSA